MDTHIGLNHYGSNLKYEYEQQLLSNQHFDTEHDKQP